jgi:hypothetical protein
VVRVDQILKFFSGMPSEREQRKALAAGTPKAAAKKAGKGGAKVGTTGGVAAGCGTGGDGRQSMAARNGGGGSSGGGTVGSPSCNAARRRGSGEPRSEPRPSSSGRMSSSQAASSPEVGMHVDMRMRMDMGADVGADRGRKCRCSSEGGCHSESSRSNGSRRSWLGFAERLSGDSHDDDEQSAERAPLLAREVECDDAFDAESRRPA